MALQREAAAGTAPTRQPPAGSTRQGQKWGLLALVAVVVAAVGFVLAAAAAVPLENSAKLVVAPRNYLERQPEEASAGASVGRETVTANLQQTEPQLAAVADSYCRHSMAAAAAAAGVAVDVEQGELQSLLGRVPR